MIASVINGLLGISCETEETTNSYLDIVKFNAKITVHHYNLIEMERLVKLSKYFDIGPLIEGEDDLAVSYTVDVFERAMVLEVEVNIPKNIGGVELYKNRVATDILYTHDEYDSIGLGPNTLFYTKTDFGFIEANCFSLSIKTKCDSKLQNESEYKDTIKLHKPNSNHIYRFNFKGNFEFESAEWVNLNGMKEMFENIKCNCPEC